MDSGLMQNLGTIIALVGAALAALMAGIGSVRGVSTAGEAAAGIVSENPDVFGKVLVLQALPGTQGIYGFIIALMVSMNSAGLTIAEGIEKFIACMPIAIVGLISAIYQGRMAACSINMLAKNPDLSGRGVTMTVVVETYAVLALIVSIMLI